MREAASRSARPVVITFDHHPDEILTGTAPPLLLDPVERLERLESAGVGVTVIQHFDDAVRRTTYDAFVGTIASRCGLAGLLMTPDAAFGFERRGTPEALAKLGAAGRLRCRRRPTVRARWTRLSAARRSARRSRPGTSRPRPLAARSPGHAPWAAGGRPTSARTAARVAARRRLSGTVRRAVADLDGRQRWTARDARGPERSDRRGAPVGRRSGPGPGRPHGPVWHGPVLPSLHTPGGSRAEGVPRPPGRVPHTNLVAGSSRPGPPLPPNSLGRTPGPRAASVPRGRAARAARARRARGSRSGPSRTARRTGG